MRGLPHTPTIDPTLRKRGLRQGAQHGGLHTGPQRMGGGSQAEATVNKGRVVGGWACGGAGAGNGAEAGDLGEHTLTSEEAHLWGQFPFTPVQVELLITLYLLRVPMGEINAVVTVSTSPLHSVSVSERADPPQAALRPRTSNVLR